MKFRPFSKATRLEVLFHYLYAMISPSAIYFELECRCLQSGKAKMTLMR
jgi:predicted transposase YdaD